MSAPSPATGPARPPASALMMQLLSGQWVAQALSVAARLGIADALAAGPRSAGDLASGAQVSEDGLYRLLRGLTVVGVFTEEPDRRFALTEVGQTLRTGVPGSTRSMAVMLGEEWHWRAFGALGESVRSGRPAFDHVYGEPFFDWLGTHKTEREVFNTAMTSFSGAAAHSLAATYDFSGVKRVVDIGGGHGLVLRTVLEAHPHLKGTVYDLPNVADGARAALAASSVADRADAVGGDFFTSIPAGADLYMMKHIIHDWSDAHCTTLLTHCRKALPVGGRVLVIEHLIPDRETPHFAKLLDLEMLAMTTGGRERSHSEFAELFSGAGLRLSRVIPTPSGIALIEAAVA